MVSCHLLLCTTGSSFSRSLAKNAVNPEKQGPQRGESCITFEELQALLDSYGREALEKTILDAIAPLR